MKTRALSAFQRYGTDFFVIAGQNEREETTQIYNRYRYQKGTENARKNPAKENKLFSTRFGVAQSSSFAFTEPVADKIIGSSFPDKYTGF
jgi:hypothetical protein